jgi:hypothetical protein
MSREKRYIQNLGVECEGARFEGPVHQLADVKVLQPERGLPGTYMNLMSMCPAKTRQLAFEGLRPVKKGLVPH